MLQETLDADKYRLFHLKTTYSLSDLHVLLTHCVDKRSAVMQQQLFPQKWNPKLQQLEQIGRSASQQIHCIIPVLMKTGPKAGQA